MADDNEAIKRDVRFSVSARLHAYLGWLAQHTVLGKTENDVAKQVLTQRLAEMRQEDYKQTDD
ncbi:MAG: hypothetical protein MI920_15435 [Kiloniellales bacterium]|nr:hypothetical protein [Kiloniellales bacterium]